MMRGGSRLFLRFQYFRERPDTVLVRFFQKCLGSIQEFFRFIVGADKILVLLGGKKIQMVPARQIIIYQGGKFRKDGRLRVRADKA